MKCDYYIKWTFKHIYTWKENVLTYVQTFLNRDDWITNEISKEKKIKNVYHLSLHTSYCPWNFNQRGNSWHVHVTCWYFLKPFWQYQYYQNIRVNTSLGCVLLCSLALRSFTLFESRKNHLNCHKYDGQLFKHCIPPFVINKTLNVVNISKLPFLFKIV